MFDRNEVYRIYKISIPIIDMLVPYWNLYVRIKGVDIINSLEFPDKHVVYKNKCTEIYNNYLQEIEGVKEDKEKYADIVETTSNRILSILTEYINTTIYNGEYFDTAFKKNILTIVFDEEPILCVTKECDEEKMKELLEKFLSKSNPILLLLKTIDSDNEEAPLSNMINNGLYTITAQRTIQEAEIRSIYAPIYQLSDFDIVIGDDECHELDVSKYWINYNLLKEFQDIEQDCINRVTCFPQNSIDSISNVHGLILDNHLLIPLVSDFKKIYKQNIHGLWREFKCGVYHHKSDNEVKYKLNPKQEQFLEKVKEEAVTNKLSFLVDNLYIPQKHIGKVDGIESFFNDVAIIDNLSELENYEFFASEGDEQDQPLIGIHKKDKAGSKSYKLLHYICKKNNKFENVRGITKADPCKKSVVKILKPELSFYYLLRYYEDFFASVLDEIKNENKNIDYITNQKVSLNNKKNEIDVIVFNGVNIYIIELKTNLSIESIVSFQKKCTEWMNVRSEFSSTMNFIIAASFGKETLNICCGNEEENGLYNTSRPDMNGWAYSFKVPLNNGKELRCFTEPSFTKLKTMLSSILIEDETTSN